MKLDIAERNGATRLYILRHGEVDGKAKEICYGQMDVGLSECGKEQSRKASERLRLERIDAVFSSDLKRCRYLADLIAEIHELDVLENSALRERHFGQWQGMEMDILFRDFSDLVNHYFANPDFEVPGGENFTSLWSRVKPWLQDTLREHRGKSLAVVTHGGPCRVILSHAMGIPYSHLFFLDQKYCALNVIDYLEDRPRVHLMNG